MQPRVRAEIEGNCKKVREGKQSLAEVIEKCTSFFKERFLFFSKNIDKIDMIFDKLYKPLSETGKRLSHCGDCKRYMLLINSKLPFLNCSECDKDYKLMHNIESIKPMNKNCAICNFEAISFKQGKFEIIICPKC